MFKIIDSDKHNTFRERACERLSKSISIIVPVYNVEKYIQDCIDSLLMQSNDNFQVIFVDDGSSDKSLLIIEKNLHKFNDSKLIKQKNRGLGGARNVGIDYSDSTYISFVDSDDIISDNFVETFFDSIDEDVDVITAGFQRLSEDGSKLEGTFHCPECNVSELWKKVLGVFESSIACSRLYRRQFIISNNLRFVEKLPHEDWFFTYKTLWLAKKSKIINRTVYYWRDRLGSLSNSVSEKYIDLIPKLCVDTKLFLISENASSEAFAFSSRRVIQAIRNIYRRIQKTNDHKLKIKFLTMIHSDEVELKEHVKLMQKNNIMEPYINADIDEIIREAQSLEVTPKIIKREKLKIDFLFIPLRAYHLDEFLEICNQLSRKGVVCKALEIESIKPTNGEVFKRAEELGIQLLSPRSVGEMVALSLKSIVVFNDWDPYIKHIAKFCYHSGIELIGFVEGIQDYRDVDTGRKRSPYLRSSRVILPGKHDKKYFRSGFQKLHLGMVTRVSQLISQRKERRVTKNVLINSNFSYGVLEEFRDQWVEDAVLAVKRAGMNPIISRHPFDEGKKYTELETHDSFYNAIDHCDVSIQRFASGILESLAIGIPVIYFNPHKELVDKFKDPKGAFLYIECNKQLESTLSGANFNFNAETVDRFLNFHTTLHQSENFNVDALVCASKEIKHYKVGFSDFITQDILAKDKKDLIALSHGISPYYEREVVDNSFTKANKYYREGRYSESYELYRGLLLESPDFKYYAQGLLNSLLALKEKGEKIVKTDIENFEKLFVV